MLKNLKIKNYQSHRDTELEFSPNVNIIVGDNQSGKTAIFRALNWLMFNRPLSGRMLHNACGNKGEVFVEAEFFEGNIVSLKKEIKKNKDGKKEVISDKSEYKFNEEPLSGFGTSVPDQITDAINLGELNIQDQLAGPFLLSSSPGEVARTINRITNLDESDEYIKEAGRKVRHFKAEVDLLTNDIEHHEKELKRYEGLEDLECILDRIDAGEKKLIELRQEIDSILETCEELVEAERKFEFLDDYLVGDMVIAVDNIEKGKAKLVELKREKLLIVELIHTENDLRLMSSFEPKWELLILLETNMFELDALSQEYTDIKSALVSVDAVKGCKHGRDVAKQEYIVAIREEGKCPTCFDPIDEETIKRIEEEL